MRCHICPRKVKAVDVPKGLYPICRKCHGREVAIYVTGRSRHQVFLVKSLSGRGQYRVTWAGLRTSCTCVDYETRARTEHRWCKHERLVRFLAKAAGGMRALVPGTWHRFQLGA